MEEDRGSVAHAVDQRRRSLPYLFRQRKHQWRVEYRLPSHTQGYYNHTAASAGHKYILRICLYFYIFVKYKYICIYSSYLTRANGSKITFWQERASVPRFHPNNKRVAARLVTGNSKSSEGRCHQHTKAPWHLKNPAGTMLLPAGGRFFRPFRRPSPDQSNFSRPENRARL